MFFFPGTAGPFIQYNMANLGIGINNALFCTYFPVLQVSFTEKYVEYMK